jgi:hypothetical protein
MKVTATEDMITEPRTMKNRYLPVAVRNSHGARCKTLVVWTAYKPAPSLIASHLGMTLSRRKEKEKGARNGKKEESDIEGTERKTKSVTVC